MISFVGAWFWWIAAGVLMVGSPIVSEPGRDTLRNLWVRGRHAGTPSGRHVMRESAPDGVHEGATEQWKPKAELREASRHVTVEDCDLASIDRAFESIIASLRTQPDYLLEARNKWASSDEGQAGYWYRRITLMSYETTGEFPVISPVPAPV